MKNISFLLLLFLSLTLSAQITRFGSLNQSVLYKSSTDTAAWLSQLRQYEPKISTSLTSRFWRGDKTWQDFTAATLAVTLSGFSLNNSAINVGDNIVSAFGKAQQQINFRELGINPGLTSQYWRGDKTWQNLNPAAVGLPNVLNLKQEPALGNPAANGYVLSSTAGGVRSWIAASSSSSLDLKMQYFYSTTQNSGNSLNVAKSALEGGSYLIGIGYAGYYKLDFTFNAIGVAASTAANLNITISIERINNTPTVLIQKTFTIAKLTACSWNLPEFHVSELYGTTRSDDLIKIFISSSAAPTSGSIYTGNCDFFVFKVMD